MAIVQVKDATGSVLDWMVAKCEGYLHKQDYGWTVVLPVPGEPVHLPFPKCFSPSTRWAQGGPIIALRQIGLDQFKGQPCRAYIGTPARYEHSMFAPEGHPLVAAMRCYVASKLGDTVEVPDELL